jgi:uncharacterized membrane protein
MRLTRKDARATVVVIGAAVFYALWLTGTVAADMSTRVVAVIVLALGWLGCTSDVDQMKVVFGVEGTRPPLLYVVLTSLVGGVALIAGAITIIGGNEAMLATLVVAMAALWIAATARHQIAGRPVLHDDEHIEVPLGRAA